MVKCLAVYTNLAMLLIAVADFRSGLRGCVPRTQEIHALPIERINVKSL